MALVALVSTRPGRADPGDIFTLAAPTLGAEAPKGIPITDGDTTVATQTGALNYGYPIQVPPGRQGAQPHLGLSYSSQAPIYGGLAAGWTLTGLPMITLDTSRGRLEGTAFAPPGRRFASSMAGGRELVEVDEATPPGSTAFRARGDGGFVRYQKMASGSPFPWRALSPDGMTYVFGDASHVGDCTIVSDEYAPLTSTSDPFGNVVEYFWEKGVESECRIFGIAWGRNDAAQIGHFASVRFQYAASPPTCAGIPVGSQSSYRSGIAIVTGASQLDTITARAFAPHAGASSALFDGTVAAAHVRTVRLRYDPILSGCGQETSYRGLTSIEESAVGTDAPLVTLPPITFKYGAASLLYQAEPATPFVPWAASAGSGPLHNLGWGYRPRGTNAWPTVEAMMVDLDGDGLIDRLVNEPLLVNGRSAFCGARWYRNLGPSRAGSGQFQPAGYIEIPTLKWATEDALLSTTPWVGGPGAGASQGQGASERCALNYQRTAYINSNDGGIAGTCSSGTCTRSADNSTGVCSDGSDCWPLKTNPAGNTLWSWRWFDIDGDGKTDLIGSPARGGLNSYNVRWAPLSNVPSSPWPRFEPPIFGVRTFDRVTGLEDDRGFPSCPATPYTAYPADPLQPYTMCRGMFPWFVYKNHGHAVFGRARAKDGSTHPHATWGREPDEIIYQPIPLETASGDSSITAGPVGVTQGTLDIDGDGYADAVKQNGSTWSVYRNDGSGRLVPATGTSPFSFGTGSLFTLSSTQASVFTAPQSVSGLVDTNGDGLVDHWDAAVGSTSANIHLSDGVSFRLGDNLVISKPGADGLTDVAPDDHRGEFICRGTRTDTRRLLDANSDGRVDIVTRGTLFPQIAFNAGGAFPGPIGTTGTPEAALLRRTIVRTEVDENVCEALSASWEIRSDMIDLDGDGIPEAVDFGAADANPLVMNLSRVASLARQPRLLVEIDNHRGAKTTVIYGSMSSPAVQQDSATGKTSPQTQWVVQSMVTTDSLSATTSTSSYLYRSPRFHPDDRGKYGFRGFDEVETTLPSGARSIKRYSYAPDWSGRLATTMFVAAAVDGTGARTIDDTTWEQRTLFGDIESFHATVAEHWACKNGQDELACRGDATGYRRTAMTLTALASTTSSDGTPLLWHPTSSRLQATALAAAGDRSTTTTFALAADADTYRLRDLETLSVEHGATTATPFARTRRTWDSTYRVALTSETWFDDVDANRAIERSVYDMTTGNAIQHIKPVQNASNGPSSSMQYDARKLFVERDSNELGHQTEYTHEYGTGVRLSTRGPNTPVCAAGVSPTCPLGTSLAEERRTRVDGLGRPIERFETFSDDGQVYTSRKVEIIDYVDTQPNGTGATSMTIRSALDVNASDVIRYRQVKTDFDGHGRPITERVSVFGSAPADQITSYRYHGDGTLREVIVPDPSRNDAATVSYLYNFDSIGRPTEIIRPDAIELADRSRIQFSYDGLTKTMTEVVGRGGGQPARMTTTADRFSRLVRVDEDAAPMGIASTHYTYAPNDRLATITDADGVGTTLVHDLAGRRVRIERAGRVWHYGYDKNGNMVSQTVPGSTGTLSDAAFTTTTAYDALDRLSSRSIGQRSLSVEDQDTFASGTEQFTWDIGPNHIGRLRFWKTFAPGATTPAVALDLDNNVQGQRTRTMQTLAVAGYPSLTRQQSQDYHLNGAPRRTQYHDGVGSSASSSSLVTQDPRGLPSSIVVSMTGRPDQTIALQTRNVAGMVTKRRTNVSSRMGYVESNWTYDRLGRITDQLVQKGPGATQVVRQTLEYFGNDDPAWLDQWIGPTNRKRLEYRYDRRHQLVSVAETAAGGAFAASYEYGTAGRFRRATETSSALPGNDVRPRDVAYEYAGVDPEQLTALRNADGSTFASYEYDAAGNQTYRCEGTIRPAPGATAGSLRNAVCVGESLYMVYDGRDRLRRVVKYMGAARAGHEEYWYDNAGTRLATVKHDSVPKKTGLIWWLGATEAHYDASGALAFVYSHPRIGTVAARIRRTRGNVSMELQFHGLGKHTIAAVDRDSGAVNVAFTYAPFGEIIEALDSSSGVATHRRRMNDKFVDEVSDLAYYGVRYYDKHSMTWTQADPHYRFAPDATWSQPRRAMLYAAHLQNPLRYLDPDGRDVVLLGSSQPKELNLSTSQIKAAAGRAGSFTSMSTEKKATKVVNNAAGATKALAGRSDNKVAYFGHGRLDSKELDPSNGRSTTITPEQLAAAISGMKQQPTDVYLYGCNTDDTGFADALAELLPGTTVHAYAGDFDVEASAPTDKQGTPKKDKAVLNPAASARETTRKKTAPQKEAAPADANEDGRVTDDEESDWMRQQQ